MGCCQGGERKLRRRKKGITRGEKSARRYAPMGASCEKNKKGIAVCSMIKAVKQNHPTAKITQQVPATLLTFEQGQTLGADRNRIINAGCRITLRQFAAKHGLRYETWRREYLRGATGFAVADPRVQTTKIQRIRPFSRTRQSKRKQRNKNARKQSNRPPFQETRARRKTLFI